MVELFVPLAGIFATFTSITVILYIYYTTRNKERLALIAKDKDASVFKAKRNSSRSGIKLGVLMIFFGIGALVGIGMVKIGLLSEEMAILGIIPIFIGFGLIVSQRFLEEKDEDLEV